MPRAPADGAAGGSDGCGERDEASQRAEALWLWRKLLRAIHAKPRSTRASPGEDVTAAASAERVASAERAASAEREDAAGAEQAASAGWDDAADCQDAAEQAASAECQEAAELEEAAGWEDAEWEDAASAMAEQLGDLVLVRARNATGFKVRRQRSHAAEPTPAIGSLLGRKRAGGPTGD